MSAVAVPSRCPAVDVHGHRCALGDVRAAHTRGRHEAAAESDMGSTQWLWPVETADEVRWATRKDVDDADRAFREVTERWRTEKARAKAAEARLAAVEAECDELLRDYSGLRALPSVDYAVGRIRAALTGEGQP